MTGARAALNRRAATDQACRAGDGRPALPPPRTVSRDTGRCRPEGRWAQAPATIQSVGAAQAACETPLPFPRWPD